MRVRVSPTSYPEVAPWRERFRAGAGCQIVRDSILRRGLAVPFSLEVDGVVAGYGGVWVEHHPGRVMEFHLAPAHRHRGPSILAALVREAGATALEAQTNLPEMEALLSTFAPDPVTEKLLFAAPAEPAASACPRPAGAIFRERQEGDVGPEGEWVVVQEGAVVAAGGVLTHYNPPWGDLYMEVVPEARGRGVGSWLVQELGRICREAGGRPAARCDPSNEASRRTLLRGGLHPCGELRAGPVDPAALERALEAGSG